MFPISNERKSEYVGKDQEASETDTTNSRQNEDLNAELVAYDPASERYILKTSEGH